jgi:hypothetical protein
MIEFFYVMTYIYILFMSSHLSIPILIDDSEIVENTIVNSLGHNDNAYLKRLMIRYLNQPIAQEKEQIGLKEIIKQPDLTQIKQLLLNELQTQKSKIQQGQTEQSTSFLINALMNEKLNEREQLVRVERHKLLLTIGVFVIPLITNLLQFLMRSYILPSSE